MPFTWLLFEAAAAAAALSSSRLRTLTGGIVVDRRGGRFGAVDVMSNNKSSPPPGLATSGRACAGRDGADSNIPAPPNRLLACGESGNSRSSSRIRFCSIAVAAGTSCCPRVSLSWRLGGIAVDVFELIPMARSTAGFTSKSHRVFSMRSALLAGGLSTGCCCCCCVRAANRDGGAAVLAVGLLVKSNSILTGPLGGAAGLLVKSNSSFAAAGGPADAGLLVKSNSSFTGGGRCAAAEFGADVPPGCRCVLISCSL